jgi:uncharacterized protein YerC
VVELGTEGEKVNREIKDGVFKLLFENKENAAELYYALSGIKCSPDEIQIITITTVVSGMLKNDLAFVVRQRVMVIGEHQSTPTANMPVRFLMYAGQLYEKWIKMRGEEKLIYGSKLYKIPTPEFVVFYNGTVDMPEKDILYLSSAFEEKTDEGMVGSLELEVPVYNINKDKNSELFAKSKKLRQYAEFVDKLREFRKMYNDYTVAAREAVNYCIGHGVLSDFFKEHGGKIMSILHAEFDLEAAKRVYAEEQIEDVLEGVAIRMLKRGLPVEPVAEDTGLSESAVMRIKERLSLSEQ